MKPQEWVRARSEEEDALETRQLSTMNWMQVESYLRSDDRLMLILGACEQHGYLSLLTDVQIPETIAQAASERTGVLVAPSVPFGYSPFFAAYPGTISLRIATLIAVLKDVIGFAYQQGFRGILAVNGHGGNDPVWTALGELVAELPGLRVDIQAWWQCEPVEKILKQHDLQAHHASGVEAFPFNRVAPLPEGEKAEVPDRGFATPAEVRRFAGDGVYGGPYVLPEEIYADLMEAAVGDAVERLERLRSTAS